MLWLLHSGVSPSELSDVLEHHSGLAGLTGGSGHLRDIADGLVFDVYIHRLRREIAAVNGLDVLVFTGGVGEHQPAVRTAAADGLGFLGVRIDDRGHTDITAPDATVRTLVILSREDVEISQQVRGIV